MMQDDIFHESEADNWFLRNVDYLNAEGSTADDPVLRVLDCCGMHPANVAEIGACNGFRLAALMKRYGCCGTAIEPSAMAIADGRKRYPDVTFVRSTAAAIPLETPPFYDLVIVNFVFHWVDRSMLLRSVAEIDRLLAPDGHIILGDFAPAYPQRVEYHHRGERDTWTYKQDYAAVFSASNLYSLEAVLPFTHDSRELRTDIAFPDRIQVNVLRKRGQERYVPASRPPDASGS